MAAGERVAAEAGRPVLAVAARAAAREAAGWAAAGCRARGWRGCRQGLHHPAPRTCTSQEQLRGLGTAAELTCSTCLMPLSSCCAWLHTSARHPCASCQQLLPGPPAPPPCAPVGEGQGLAGPGAGVPKHVVAGQHRALALAQAGGRHDAAQGGGPPCEVPATPRPASLGRCTAAVPRMPALRRYAGHTAPERKHHCRCQAGSTSGQPRGCGGCPPPASQATCRTAWSCTPPSTWSGRRWGPGWR